MRYALVGALFVCGVLAAQEAERLRALAARLRMLREEMEARRRALVEEVERIKRQVAGKKALVSSLEEELKKADGALKQAHRRVEDLKKEKEQLAKEREKLKELLEKARRRLNEGILSSIPYKQGERTVAPQEQLGRLFDGVVEGHLNDISLSCSVEAYRDILSVGGKHLRGYMVRLGLVGMVFAGDEGEAALWTPSGWRVTTDVAVWRAIRRLAEQALKRAVPSIVTAPLCVGSAK